MALAGTIQEALPGKLGFDVNRVLKPADAREFAKGYAFCLRYVRHANHENPTPGVLSAGEAQEILDAGLALMPVQYGHKPGWVPVAGLGQLDGKQAGDSAEAIGFPQSNDPSRALCVWCDLEGVKGNTPWQDVRVYCNEWAAAVAARGYSPGLYVGYGCILNEQQLSQLDFEYYWRSQSRTVPNVNPKGFQLIQVFPQIRVNGLDLDIDVTQWREGSTRRSAYWLAR